MYLEGSVLADRAIVTGLLFVGLLLATGSIIQLVKGETWGATGRGRVRRADSPAYFWYLFLARMILGTGMVVVSLVVLF